MEPSVIIKEVQQQQFKPLYFLHGEESYYIDMLAEEIQKHLPGFEISYASDFRQGLADSWPNSIDDSSAKNDWGWEIEYPMPRLVSTMLEEIAKKVS